MRSKMAAHSCICVLLYQYLRVLRRTRSLAVRGRRRRRLVRRRRLLWQCCKEHNNLMEFVVRLTGFMALAGSIGERSIWSTKKSGHWWEQIANEVFSDQDWLRNFRMRQATFNYLCAQLQPKLRKQNTHLRQSVEVKKSVEYRTIAQLFGVGTSTVCTIVHEVCNAIVSELTPRLIRLPKGDAMTENIEGFEARWGFPQCGGAVDGTHLPVLPPHDFRVDYFNRKGWYSVVLQGMVDYQYRFMNINVGFPGSVHDSRVFANSAVFNLGEAGDLFPQITREIEGVQVPIVLLANSAYPLLPWVMKPYTDTGALSRQQKTFNYRLSRARMVTENAYGRLKGRWRILMKRNDTSIEKLPNLVTACCTLHNLCEVAGEVFDEALLQGTEEGPADPVRDKNAALDNDAEEIRNALMDHVNSNNL